MEGKLLVEICCASLEDCLTAKRCGADAIELVTAHLLGGLTPSAGLLERAIERAGLPVNAIVRPRAAGFCYSDEDFETMCADARLYSKMGANGIVFGFLRADGSLDYERCARFLDCVGDCETVFHRAIDVAENLRQTAETLVSLGVTRILTSGGKASAIEGASVIRALVQGYGDRLQILAGGGVRAENIVRLVAETGVTRVHLGGTSHRADPSTNHNPDLNFGTDILPPNDSFLAVDGQKLETFFAATRGNL